MFISSTKHKILPSSSRSVQIGPNSVSGYIPHLKQIKILLNSINNTPKKLSVDCVIHNKSLHVYVNNFNVIVLDGEYSYKSIYNISSSYDVENKSILDVLKKLKLKIMNTNFTKFIFDAFIYSSFYDIVIDYKVEQNIYLPDITKKIFSKLYFDKKIIVDIENSNFVFPFLDKYIQDYLSKVLIYSYNNEDKIPNNIKKRLDDFDKIIVPFKQKDSADVVITMYISYLSNDKENNITLFTCDHFANIMDYYNIFMNDVNMNIVCNLNQILDDIENLL